jgi:basic membrane protein A and related proteins
VKKFYLFFKWAGVFIIIALLFLSVKNRNVKASGESAPSLQSSSSASSQQAVLAEDDLPGFRQAGESEVAGYLALAKRLTSGLMSSQAGISDISTFRIKNLFRSEYVISFLAYPITENDELVFGALAINPQSILETLTGIAQASGVGEEARLLSNLGGLGDRSMGFSMTLGQEPVAQNIDLIWVRRGEVVQSTWVIYPAGEAPSIDLRKLGLLVDQRVAERFPGTIFRPAGLLVPVITTHIPTPLDISTRPGVIGTNLLLAALMMLPFALAAEIFTRLSAEREELLRDKFRPARWLLNLPRRFENFLGRSSKQRGANILRLLVIIFFYGLTFSLLDRTWKPFSVTGLVLFLNMTIAYGLVGIADDIVQWRVINKKWKLSADINLRPTNIFIAVASTITSRLFTLIPGLMFGTPEALILDEARLGAKRRNYLLKISAYTLLAIGFGLWALTTLTALVQQQNISEGLRNGIGGLEGFLLVVFAVALENTFTQMLGLPGSFGEALRKKSRWLWALGLTLITFAFYHTLINPRGELSAALKQSNVRLFLGAAAVFVIFTFSLWAYLSIKGRKPSGNQQSGRKNPGRDKPGKIIPAWVWLAVLIIGLTVVGDIIITRHNRAALQPASTSTLTAGAPAPIASPTPVPQASNEVKLSFTVPVAINKLCLVPAVSITENMTDSYTWRSIQLVAAQYGAQAEYLEPETTDEAGYARVIDQLMQDNCSLIVGNWFTQMQVFQTAAAENPGQDFMFIAGGPDLPNLWVTKYSLPEGAYFAGYLAAAASQSGKVGTYGGLHIPVVVSSMNCFALGVKDFNKAQKADVAVLGWSYDTNQGTFANSFSDPGQGLSLSNDLVSQGADIIFPVAGASSESTGYGTGLVAGQQEGVYVIGVDLDWVWAMPEFANEIISSAQTRYDQSITLAVDALANEEFHGGVHEGTLASGEISLSPLRGFSGLVSSEVIDQMVHQSNPAVLSVEMSACQIPQYVDGFLNLDAVGGANWPASARPTIRVFSAPGGELLFTGEGMTDQDGNFYQNVGVDLVAGMAVEVDDGMETESVTLVPLTLDVIDPDADIVSGTAPGGAVIFLYVGEIDGKTGAFLSVTADSNGLWQANFTGQFDITSRTGVQVKAPDADGNGTVIKISLEEMRKQSSAANANLTPSPTSTPPSPTSTPVPTATTNKGVYDTGNGHWYLVTPQMDWDSARDYCSSRGGRLLIINDAAEDGFIFNLAPYAFLGATDSGHEGRWVWVTGEPLSYTNWNPGEPNNCDGDDCSPENYLAYAGNVAQTTVILKWNDVSTDGIGEYICEWEK